MRIFFLGLGFGYIIWSVVVKANDISWTLVHHWWDSHHQLCCFYLIVLQSFCVLNLTDRTALRVWVQRLSHSYLPFLMMIHLYWRRDQTLFSISWSESCWLLESEHMDQDCIWTSTDLEYICSNFVNVKPITLNHFGTTPQKFISLRLRRIRGGLNF